MHSDLVLGGVRNRVLSASLYLVALGPFSFHPSLLVLTSKSLVSSTEALSLKKKKKPLPLFLLQIIKHYACVM